MLILFLIPLLTVLLIYIIFPHRLVWWEILLPFAVPCICIPSCQTTSFYSQTRDTEVWGGWVTEVEYLEDWNEYIRKRCTRKVGKVTTSYDCSYVRYHPEEYWAYTSNNEKIRITSERYHSLSSLYGTQKFEDLHRRYHTNDGDRYYARSTKLTPVFTQHIYENRVQASSSVFNYPEVKDKRVYDYPTHNHFENISVLGGDSLPINVLNAKYGSLKEIRVLVCIFNGPKELGFLQEAKWKGGNKNELVICLGNRSNVEWVHSFCWSPDEWSGNENLKVVIREALLNKKFDEEQLAKLIESNLTLWKRKDFDEFKYLKVSMKTSDYIFCAVVTILLNCLISFWAIINEFDHVKVKFYNRYPAFR